MNIEINVLKPNNFNVFYISMHNDEKRTLYIFLHWCSLY
jgi:hypothetical protein